MAYKIYVRGADLFKKLILFLLLIVILFSFLASSTLISQVNYSSDLDVANDVMNKVGSQLQRNPDLNVSEATNQAISDKKAQQNQQVIDVNMEFLF
jgi:hypothetical protein